VMGMDKLSVSARSINILKATIAGLDPSKGEAALAEALAAPDAASARAALSAWVHGS